MSRPHEVIVEVGAEGGGLCLYGSKELGTWKFTFERNESTLQDVLDTEDQDLDDLLHWKSNRMDTWNEALEQLNTYPWHKMFPITIHPDFSVAVWKAVLAHHSGRDNGYSLWRWISVCFPAADQRSIAQLSLWLKQSTSTVVLTGAGMSTESGIPDFRSKDGR